MAYVVTAGCTKDGECIETCVTESIKEGTYTDEDGNLYDQMFIDPESCIDCGNCESVCPQTAIMADADLPSDLEKYAAVNAAFHRQ